MHEIIRNPRHGCDLHGALKTVEALNDAVPIVHANAGCVYQHYLSDWSGHLASGGVRGPEVPGTEITEKHVVFGGASRLREQIKNTVKVIDGSLYVVLGSCEAAMVGDDLAAMIKEAREINLPAVFYFSAGFRGGSHLGYAQALKAIIEQLSSVKKIQRDKEKGLVNILGILPKTDIFYKGDLFEIERLLGAAGLRANTLFNPGSGVAGLENCARAEHTLVFSFWGIPGAKKLQELYGIPYTLFDSLPLGIDEAGDFYSRLASFVSVDEEKTKEFLEYERRQNDYYIRALADTYYAGNLRKQAALVGDTSTVIRVARFLSRYLGVSVSQAILTDHYSNGKDEEAPAVPEGIGEEIFTTGDSGEIGQILSGGGAEIILGSAIEAQTAEDMHLPHLAISYPDTDRLPLHKTYAGIRGAYFLMEDYAGAVLKNNREKEDESRRFLEKTGLP